MRLILLERWSRSIGIDAVANAAYIIGEMAEWSNAAVSKTVVRLPVDRGFESPSLRKAEANHPDDLVRVVLFYEGPYNARIVKVIHKTKHLEEGFASALQGPPTGITSPDRRVGTSNPQYDLIQPRRG
jgi:hypothetical protein